MNVICYRTGELPAHIYGDNISIELYMQEFDLREYLRIHYQGISVDFFRFPGNYGDSLIWHGTKKILSLLNISVTYVDINSKQSNDVLFIDGGGNLVDYYSDIKNFLIAKSSLYRQIVILPHTIFGQRQIEVLNSITIELTVFCREKVSAEFLKKNLTRGNVFLWHDCAFYNEFSKDSAGEGILNAFRTDKESTLMSLPDFNIDISHSGYAMKPLDELLTALRPYKQVNTDRLHVGIAAALLNKEVRLYANSYYKNEAVFDYSLREFANVQFIKK